MGEPSHIHACISLFDLIDISKLISVALQVMNSFRVMLELIHLASG